MKKCPKCGNEIVDIIYGLPDSETIEKVEKKKAKLGGCEIVLDMEQPVYYCYQCDEEYFEDLIIGKYRFIGTDGNIDLVKGKIYNRIHNSNDPTGFYIIDDSGESYLYLEDDFEEVK